MVSPPHPWIHLRQGYGGQVHGRRSEHLRGINSIFISKKLVFADENKIRIVRVAIHSAVHVFMGEADEIATQSPSGFCGRIFDKP